MSNENHWSATEQDRVTVVRLNDGHSTIYESQLVNLSGILDLAESVGPPWLVLDLTGTSYFGSAFIGFLISVSNRIRERAGGRLALCGLSAFSRMALQSSKTDQLLELFDSQVDAVAALIAVRNE